MVLLQGDSENITYKHLTFHSVKMISEEEIRCVFDDNYAPNFEKVGGHIGFGLSVRTYVFMFEISS